MLAIKLQRIGKRHQPSYRVVVAEKRSKLQGPAVEDIGSYNPFTKALQVKRERVAHWLTTGAQPTVTVHNLFVKHSLLEAPRIKIRIRKTKKSGEVSPAAEVATGTATSDKKESTGAATPEAA